MLDMVKSNIKLWTILYVVDSICLLFNMYFYVYPWLSAIAIGACVYSIMVADRNLRMFFNLENILKKEK